MFQDVKILLSNLQKKVEDTSEDLVRESESTRKTFKDPNEANVYMKASDLMKRWSGYINFN